MKIKDNLFSNQTYTLYKDKKPDKQFNLYLCGPKHMTQLLVSLANSGEDKNTLVYFTSDHGGHIDIGVNGGWNAPFRQVNFILIHDVDHH